jgi:Fur family transcriptional regulator, peroxide stress response regulator
MGAIYMFYRFRRKAPRRDALSDSGFTKEIVQYRHNGNQNFAILIEQGIIKKINAGSTFDLFEAKNTPHYDLICRKCGTIIDFEERLFPEIEAIISKAADFTVESHRIDFFGTCNICRARNRNNS